MGRKSKKEWIYVYKKLIHFVVQQKLDIVNNYMPIKIKKRTSKWKC